MKEKMIIRLDDKDLARARVKGMKERSRERAKSGRSLKSQVFVDKKKAAQDNWRHQDEIENL